MKFKRLSRIRLEIDNDHLHGNVLDMPKKTRARERGRVDDPRKASDISRAIILYGLRKQNLIFLAKNKDGLQIY